MGAGDRNFVQSNATAWDFAAFQARLKRAREQRGFTRVELARVAGVSASYVVALENSGTSARRARLPKLFKLASTLRVDPEWLLRGLGALPTWNAFDLQRPRCVYFARRFDGAIKIGTSTRPVERLREFRANGQGEHELIGITAGGFDRERELHARFRSARIEGEWFRPTADLVDFVESAIALNPFQWKPHVVVPYDAKASA